MYRTPAIAVLALAATFSLSACNRDKFTELAPANLALSAERVEFGSVARNGAAERTVILSNTGEVSLGIASIGLASTDDPLRGHAGSFTVTWDPSEIEGGDPVDTDPNSEDTDLPPETDVQAPRAPAPLPWDTGVEDTDVGDTDADSDVADTDDTDAPALVFAAVLPPGAHLPVHVAFSPLYPDENFDALVVVTADEDEESDSSAAERVYRDADELWQMSILHGTETSPDVRVGPTTIDLGTIPPGDSAPAYITIDNVGEGPLTVQSVALASDCTAGFSLADAPSAADPVPAGSASVAEVRFDPTTTAEARCTVTVTTDDPDLPEQRAKIVANRPSDPRNHAPRVEILSPAPGYRHDGTGPIHMRLIAADLDQSNSTLVCKVKSTLQLQGALATCTPPDGSGYTDVDVEISGYLDPGVDVITLTATDQNGIARSVSIPISLNMALPADDEDGDVFSPNDPDHPDCDDHDPDRYPFAAEIADGKDNDCDSRVDEGTDGGDDDADGIAELDGDCDDTRADVYPEAPEAQDALDNDCDGAIDESTSAYDDDADGFTELELDCDDQNPKINPSIVEICDNQRDDNCNGLRDTQETCIASEGTPMIVGGVQLDQTGVTAAGTLGMSALVYDPDGTQFSYDWSIEGDAGDLDNSRAQRVTWTAPPRAELEGDIGGVYRVAYLVTDAQGNQAWAFTDVEVYKRTTVSSPILIPTDGCSTSPGGPGAVLVAALAALFAKVRKNR